jgi:DNA oxidative demethylase
MSRFPRNATGDLLDAIGSAAPGPEPLAEGAVVLRGFASAAASKLSGCVRQVTEISPFRHMVTPGGLRMSVAMTNCGAVGWVSDRTGYRYDPLDPATQRPWPAMPGVLRALAVRAAAAGGYAGFEPDACLINRYEPGARLSLHQDRNERSWEAPVVSISLGLPATFLFGGSRRSERPRRVRLASADVVVWGGPARLAFHGVAPLEDGLHLATGHCRINFTVRAAL